MLEKIPAALSPNHSNLVYAGMAFLPIIISACLFSIIFAHRHRGAKAKAAVVNTPRNTSLVLSKNDHPGTHIGLYTHSHINGSKSSDIQNYGEFVYDFTNDSSEEPIKQFDINRQEQSPPIEDVVLPQLEHIIGRHKDTTTSAQAIVERSNKPSINGRQDHIIHTWQTLGKHLSQSIITMDIDMRLLDTINAQIEQYGVWVTPFIASALSREIHDDTLLTYSLNLCVTRLSELQHKAAFEPAVCDLARYLCILQRFFPTLFEQIIPNLQQGLTMALHIVTAEVGAETDGNTLLAMLQQVLADIRANQLKRRLDLG
jgi:hypothetical protein